MLKGWKCIAKNAIQAAKANNTESKLHCNAKIVRRLVWSATEKKFLNAQNVSKALYYKKQLVNLNAIFNGLTKAMESANNVLIFQIVFNVLFQNN